MNLFLSIIIPTLLSVIIILYFRRIDRRNTQLQTLKSFINNAVNNMNHIFHEKEKELKDKTISLDIALKKLDKASAFINNKMTEIDNSIKQITAIRQVMSNDLKEAAGFDRNMNEIRNKLVELSKVTSEVETLKKDIAEAKKGSIQIKSDIEQSRVWAEDNINDAMKKTLDDIAAQKSQSYESIKKMQEEVDSRQKEMESFSSKLAVHNTAVQEMNGKLGKFIKEVSDKFKAELAAIKNSAGSEAGKFIESVNKKESGLNEMIQTLQDDLSKAIEDIRTVGKDSMDSVLSKIRDREKELTDSIEDAQDKIDNVHKMIDTKFEQTYKELMAKEEYGIENVKNTIRTTIEKVKESSVEEIQELKTQMSDLNKDVTDETRRMKELERAMAEHEKALEAAKKDHIKNMESLKDEYQKLMDKNSRDGMEKMDSLMEDFKDQFKKEFEKYVGDSTADYEAISDRIKGLTKGFKEMEEEAVSAIQDRTASLETDFTRRINEIANNFDGYIKKAEEELENTLDNSKEEIRSVMSEVESGKKELKEQVLGDLRELGKRTKEIEARYDALIKKTSILEKSEGLAEKSNRNIKMISQFLKELDIKKKEIETALKNMDAIKSEHKALDSMLAGIAANKKESQNIYDTVSEALEKAKDAQEILGIIEKQYSKVDDVKAVLMETLQVYEEIRTRIADAEKKRDIINNLIDSVDTAKDDIKIMTEKVSLIEDKVTTMNKVSKKIEEDVKVAQSKIEGLFKDQDRIGSAVDKISDIESLLIHIDEEGKKVQKMREWVAKLETQLERIKESQEGSMSGPSSGRRASVDKASEEDATKNILRLKEQGWSVEDISKSLKMSRAYVELIIERYEE